MRRSGPPPPAASQRVSLARARKDHLASLRRGHRTFVSRCFHAGEGAQLPWERGSQAGMPLHTARRRRRAALSSCRSLERRSVAARPELPLFGGSCRSPARPAAHHPPSQERQLSRASGIKCIDPACGRQTDSCLRLPSVRSQCQQRASPAGCCGSAASALQQRQLRLRWRARTRAGAAVREGGRPNPLELRWWDDDGPPPWDAASASAAVLAPGRGRRGRGRLH